VLLDRWVRKLLTNKGPFWVTAAAPGFHWIVVNGMYSDGSDDNTVVRINDPWGPALRAFTTYNHGGPVRAFIAAVRQRV
jgi:hypothetical protein